MSPNLINKVFTIHGFNSRKKDASISTGYMHHFLFDPSHWQNFLGQNSSFPSSIIALNVNNCNWLPVEQLCDATVQLEKLEELSVRGTRVSLPHLSRVLKSCPKLNLLEKDWEEVQAAVSKAEMDSIITNFKKLSSLKITTFFLGARDYLNDPWLLIIRILR